MNVRLTLLLRNILIFIVGVMTFIAMSGCAGLAQRVALPGSYLKPPQSTVPDSDRYEIVHLTTTDGTRIVAQFGAALDSSGSLASNPGDRPTILFFYGNQMSVAASQEIFEDLRRMGVNVMIPEYPGYGMNEGTPSERGCYAAADAAYAYLRGRSDVDPGLIVPAGLSIGGGVAVDLASRMPVAALLLVVPFTKTSDVGKDNLAWYLRWTMPLLTKHVAFDNLAKIRRITRPILIVEALRDQLIPSKRSEQLATSAPTRVTRVKVDTNHDGAWNASRDQVKEWLDETFPLQMTSNQQFQPLNPQRGERVSLVALSD